MIRDSDLIVVERGGALYRVRGDAVDDLLDTDILLVERAGVNYQMPMGDAATHSQAGDLCMVERGEVLYQTAAADVLGRASTAPVIDTITLSANWQPGITGFASHVFGVQVTMTALGNPLPELAVKAWVEGEQVVVKQTSNVTQLPNQVKLSDYVTVEPGITIESGTLEQLFDGRADTGPIFNCAPSISAKVIFQVPGVPVNPTNTQVWCWANNDIRQYDNFRLYDTSGSNNGPNTGSDNKNLFLPSGTDLRRMRFNYDSGKTFDRLELTLKDGHRHQWIGIHVGPGNEQGEVIFNDGPFLGLTLPNDPMELASPVPGDLQVGARVHQGSATAIVSSINGNQLELEQIEGTFVLGQPLTYSETEPNAKSWLLLNAQSEVRDLVPSDPGYMAWDGGASAPYSGVVAFPAVLESGSSPDELLMMGNVMTVEVRAANAFGFSIKQSNALDPYEGIAIAGPITSVLQPANNAQYVSSTTGDPRLRPANLFDGAFNTEVDGGNGGDQFGTAEWRPPGGISWSTEFSFYMNGGASSVAGRKYVTLEGIGNLELTKGNGWNTRSPGGSCPSVLLHAEIAALRIDGQVLIDSTALTLQFAGGTDLSGFQVGQAVTSLPPGGTGTISAIGTDSIAVDGGGGWLTGMTVVGPTS